MLRIAFQRIIQTKSRFDCIAHRIQTAVAAGCYGFDSGIGPDGHNGIDALFLGVMDGGQGNRAGQIHIGILEDTVNLLRQQLLVGTVGNMLDHGQIIERGDHADLIKQKGTYYQLYTGKLELS